MQKKIRQYYNNSSSSNNKINRINKYFLGKNHLILKE
jgi:hypothetical protein